MSDFVLKECEFYCFKNTPKDGTQLHEKAPIYKGAGLINGVEKDMAIWVNKEKKYLYVKINEKFVPKQKQEDNTSLPPQDDGKDLPF
jgi:hypothetical protein